MLQKLTLNHGHHLMSFVLVNTVHPQTNYQTKTILQNVAIAMHCNLRPPDVMPVVLCFTYDANNAPKYTHIISIQFYGVIHLWRGIAWPSGRLDGGYKKVKQHLSGLSDIPMSSSLIYKTLCRQQSPTEHEK